MVAVPKFPHTVGPFKVVEASVQHAAERFYSMGYPKPDPDSNAGTMCGFDMTVLGYRIRELVYAQFSPLHRITLCDEAKKAAKIAEEAVYFVWCYPAVFPDELENPLTGDGPVENFFQFGGFVYFNAELNICKVNAITPTPLGQDGVMFGRPQPLNAKTTEKLTLLGRFQPITLEILTSVGAAEFAWIRPSEFSDTVASANGCFAYKFTDGGAKYFPVVNQAVFTLDLLNPQEPLSKDERWITVRSAELPLVERFFIASTSGNLNDVAASCANDTDAKDLLKLPDAEKRLRIELDGNEGESLTFAEWLQDDRIGSILKPWVFNLPAAG